MLTSHVTNKVTSNYEKVFTNKEQFYNDIEKNNSNYNTASHKFRLNSCKRVWIGKEKTDIKTAVKQTLNLLNEVIERNDKNKLHVSFITETEVQNGDIKTYVNGHCFYDKITKSYYRRLKVEQRIGTWEFDLKDFEETGILPTVGYTNHELQQFQVIKKATNDKMPLKIKANISTKVAQEFENLFSSGQDPTQPIQISYYT